MDNSTKRDIDYFINDIHQGSGAALEELAFYLNDCAFTAKEGEGLEAITYAIEKLLKL